MDTRLGRAGSSRGWGLSPPRASNPQSGSSCLAQAKAILAPDQAAGPAANEPQETCGDTWAERSPHPKSQLLAIAQPARAMATPPVLGEDRQMDITRLSCEKSHLGAARGWFILEESFLSVVPRIINIPPNHREHG